MFFSFFLSLYSSFLLCLSSSILNTILSRYSNIFSFVSFILFFFFSHSYSLLSLHISHNIPSYSQSLSNSSLFYSRLSSPTSRTNLPISFFSLFPLLFCLSIFFSAVLCCSPNSLFSILIFYTVFSTLYDSHCEYSVRSSVCGSPGGCRGEGGERKNWSNSIKRKMRNGKYDEKRKKKN
jgi:hypothetical protein